MFFLKIHASFGCLHLYKVTRNARNCDNFPLGHRLRSLSLNPWERSEGRGKGGVSHGPSGEGGGARAVLAAVCTTGRLAWTGPA